MNSEVFVDRTFQTYSNELSVVTKLFTHSSLTFTCSWTDISDFLILIHSNRYNLSKNNHIDSKAVFLGSKEHSRYIK